jgi:hypothetical protein
MAGLAAGLGVGPGSGAGSSRRLAAEVARGAWEAWGEGVMEGWMGRLGGLWGA